MWLFVHRQHHSVYEVGEALVNPKLSGPARDAGVVVPLDVQLSADGLGSGVVTLGCSLKQLGKMRVHHNDAHVACCLALQTVVSVSCMRAPQH